MGQHKTKVAIVGAGNVGATCAYTLSMAGIVDEIVLIDLNHDKAYAEALDIEHATYFMQRNTKIYAGSYEDTTDADILIVTAAAPMPKDAHSRLEQLAPTMHVMESVINGVLDAHFDGQIIVVSNPVDVMTYYAWKLSGFEPSRVIGSGTALDTARLCCYIARDYDIKPDCVDAFVLGEHGDSELCAFSQTRIGACALDTLLAKDDKDAQATKAELTKETVEAGWEIFNRKGNTCYGIAASTTAIVRAILADTADILPVSTYVDGQYGIDGVYLSVPTVLGRDGVVSTIEADLSDNELAALQKSAHLLKSFYSQLD